MVRNRSKIAAIAAAVVAIPLAVAPAANANSRSVYGPYYFDIDSHCLDANKSSVYNNTCERGNDYQRFSVTVYASRLVSLKSAATGKCLDGSSSGDLYVGSCNGSNFQAFEEEGRNVNGKERWRYRHYKSRKCLALYFDEVRLGSCDATYVWWRQRKSF